MVYGALQRLFAESCPACGLASAGGFCSACAGELTRVRDACPKCGLVRDASIDTCGNCGLAFTLRTSTIAIRPAGPPPGGRAVA